MKNLFRKIVNKILLPYSRLSYAQSGEDIILANLFYKLNIQRPTYLDIGANNPNYISNTYYFYLTGSSGVCIEPNPRLCRKFRRVRPRDKVINVGVGIDERQEADFYLFPPHADGLSTLSKKEADYWGEIGMEGLGKIHYEQVIRIPLKNINELIRDNFERCPDFISIDVEGLDLQILKTLNFDAFQPRVLIVETLCYDEKKKEFKNTDAIEFLQSKGYGVYADTHINSIFLRKEI
jgi:FkbM family methyltransferase